MSASQVIAIDGPAASGKSSVAREVARRLGWLYVNTGNMYRAATLAALADGISPADETAVSAASAHWPIISRIVDHRCVLQLAGRDIEGQLNSDEVNAGVSFVARVPAVRDRLVALQRSLGLAQPSVLEGRDIGTVVFPSAAAKFYIDASEEVRARRRSLQGQADAVGERDRIDSTRKVAPLMVAADAVVIDSSELSLEEVTACVMNELQRRGICAA